MQRVFIIAAMICMVGITGKVTAGGVTYKDGDRYVKVGGRLQLQYHREDPVGGAATDELLLRCRRAACAF